MPQLPFCAAAYANESLAIEAQEAINIMTQIDESGLGRAKLVLVGTPGLALFGTLPYYPIRGIWGGDGRAFAVAQNPSNHAQSALFEVLGDGTYINRSIVSSGHFTGTGMASPLFQSYMDYQGPPAGGFMVDNGLPASFAPNGTQLLVVTGGQVYCDSGSGPILQYFSSVKSDMVVGPTNQNQLTAASSGVGAWDSSDVGNTITITSQSGPGWYLGTYNIIGIDGSGNATTSANVGTLGATMGAGYETLINDGPISASCCEFLNGYFLVAGLNVTGSQTMGPKQLNISHPYEGRIWEILDNGVKQAYPDNIQALLSDHSELWVFGDNMVSEIWRDTGGAGNNAAFPFETDESAIIHQNLVARFSPVSIANSVAWLSGSDTRGGPMAWLSHGYAPQRISTHPLEEEWAKYTRVDDAIGYAYTDRGHQVYVISFPTANTTWAYDVVTGHWHRRGWWNGSSWDRHRVAFHTYEFKKHLGADWSNGNIYRMDMTLYDDNGTPIYSRRTAPYLTSEFQRIPHNKLRIDMEYNAALTLTLSWSDDMGKTWTADRAVDGVVIDHGNPAQTLGVEWRRLATPRIRMYRVTISGAARRSIVQAYVNSPD